LLTLEKISIDDCLYAKITEESKLDSGQSKTITLNITLPTTPGS